MASNHLICAEILREIPTHGLTGHLPFISTRLEISIPSTRINPGLEKNYPAKRVDRGERKPMGWGNS